MRPGNFVYSWKDPPNTAHYHSYSQYQESVSITETVLSSVQSHSHVWLCNPMDYSTTDSPSVTNSLSLPKFMSIQLVMPSNHRILCHRLFLLPSIFPSIRVFCNESVLHIRWQKYWSFNFSISPSNEYAGLISFRIDWFKSLQSKGFSRVFSNITVQKHQFFSAQLSSWSNSHIHTWLLEKPKLWLDGPLSTK